MTHFNSSTLHLIPVVWRWDGGRWPHIFFGTEHASPLFYMHKEGSQFHLFTYWLNSRKKMTSQSSWRRNSFGPVWWTICA